MSLSINENNVNNNRHNRHHHHNQIITDNGHHFNNNKLIGNGQSQCNVNGNIGSKLVNNNSKNSQSLNGVGGGGNGQTSLQLQQQQQQEQEEREREQKMHIKKPLNAFMIYMKEMRSKVIAESTLKESAAINQILGKKVMFFFCL